MTMIPCPPPDFSPRKPGTVFPAGATDCHAHVFGPAERYPYDGGRSYTPPDASLEAYRHMLDTLGVQRAVLVQPSVYGEDNRAHLDALAEAGPDFRMVAVVGPGVADAELEAMHAAGVRGVRLNVVNRMGIGPDTLDLDNLDRLAQRLKALGWHIQVFADPEVLAASEARLARLPIPLVIDHMGHLPGDAGLAHPGGQALLRLVRGGNTWVKLSGAYRVSTFPTPPFADVVPIAQGLIEANPDRMVWGTDWPHPIVNDRPMPNDGDLADLLADWASDENLRQRILVDNPARLYDFPPL